jgi:RHH-type proline utilization regulon transcriptional repressor/proline dehydrogenase/delta 1-pyrroline-5-carboxylate dehydrogenase
LWQAGVSRRTLQFLPCSGGSTGMALITHPDVDFVILTGGTETGMGMLSAKDESWALKPRYLDDNPHMWTPGIKWDVKAGSFTHTTELFGPVLGVMPAENLEHAMELANATGYGLTSGLESLDRREQEAWKEGIKAGNLYINRGTTGAVTLRQPFGGMGKSALGAAIKAGSPNYVSQFMTFEEIGYPRMGAIKKDHALLRLAQEW